MVLSILHQMADMHAKEDIEKKRQLELSKGQGSGGGGSGGSKTSWTEEEIQMLIKAVNLFPAGTSQR